MATPSAWKGIVLIASGAQALPAAGVTVPAGCRLAHAVADVLRS